MLVKTLVATLFVIGVALAEQTPVFLWGANSPSKPSLQTVPQETFTELVGKLLEDHMVVAFQEDGLTPSDFLCANAETSLSCYAYLQNVQNKNYYASVENPATAIRSAAEVREFNTVSEDGQLETPVECAKGKAIFVNFEQTSQLRSEQLAQHDAAIASIAKSMSCPTVFLYMPAASSTANSRKRRSVLTAAPNGGYIYRQGAQFLMFYQNFYYIDASGQKEVIFTDAMTVTNSTSNANQFSVSLTSTDAKVLSFDITYSIDGYYTMSNVQFDSQGFYSSSVTAPIRFSYYCGNLTLAGVPPGTVNNPPTVPSPNALLWNSLQIQAPFGATSNATFVFGDPWHCVGFFTPGILSGLFVVILLLAIIFIGICWMMDINTMDRFDDPKGKTITINATD